MTYDRYKFDQLCSKCPINIVTNANGVSSPIIVIGTVPSSLSLTLKDVLFVLLLNCNLISIKQITKSHILSCTFFPTHFSLQDIHTKEKIGSGRESGGLYYLEYGFQHF